MVAWVYTCVEARLLCPSNSFTALRLAPLFIRCVANVCRRTWGLFLSRVPDPARNLFTSRYAYLGYNFFPFSVTSSILSGFSPRESAGWRTNSFFFNAWYSLIIAMMEGLTGMILSLFP